MKEIDILRAIYIYISQVLSRIRNFARDIYIPIYHIGAKEEVRISAERFQLNLPRVSEKRKKENCRHKFRARKHSSGARSVPDKEKLRVTTIALKSDRRGKGKRG